LLVFSKEKKLLRWFLRSLDAQHYFPTPLDMAGPADVVRLKLTGVDWTGSVGGHRTPRARTPRWRWPRLVAELRASQLPPRPSVNARAQLLKFAPHYLIPLLTITNAVIFRD